GIDAKPKLDLDRMMARKDKVIGDLTKGIAHLFRKNKISHVEGTGSVTAPGMVRVTQSDGQTIELTAKHIILATGSEPTPLPGVEIDEKRIVSSTGALCFEKVPKHLVVVGAGVIGLELGSVWKRLGADVTVVEFLDRIVPSLDSDIAKQAMRMLKKQGLNFKMQAAVMEASLKKTSVDVTINKGDSEEVIACDRLLVAIGRRPYTRSLGLENVGITPDDRGFIPVDARFATACAGVYAIGDCILGPMLAHKAEEDGVACVEMLAGLAGHVDYDLVPGIIYTAPEVADIGKTEDTLKAEGANYKVGGFPMSANSRARAAGQNDGVVKILSDSDTDRILGASIIAADAGNMIHEIAAVMAFGGSAEDLARICHGHPTLSEAVKEAALAINSGAIHM
ncbi:MAG: dihydrolipoyl dehydrogenase, partial [Pseudomonadota bacterium]